jgi:hypothetical protein
MNKAKAFSACHEIMLINPGYVARENSTVSYILIQISDTPDSVGISGMIIDPELPEEGNPGHFLRMPLNQRIAMVALKRMTHQVSRTHQEMQEIERLASNKETWDEAVELLTKLFGKSLHRRDPEQDRGN